MPLCYLNHFLQLCCAARRQREEDEGGDTDNEQVIEKDETEERSLKYTDERSERQ